MFRIYWLVCLMPFAWGQEWVVSHLTRPGQGFQTQILLENTQALAEAVLLKPHDAQGQALPEVALIIEPFQSRVLQANELGPDSIAWLKISSSSVLQVSVVYQASGGAARVVVPAQLPGDQFRLHPSSTDDGLVWDGVALVNVANTNNQVSLTARRLDHSLIDGVQWTLTAHQKVLAVLSDTLPLAGQAGYYEVVSTQPIGLTGLSGTQDRSLIWAPSAQPLKLYTPTTFQVRGEGPFQAKASVYPVSGQWDSNWNGGTAFDLVDDGSLGDATSGDGVWSRRFLLEPYLEAPFHWGPLHGGVWLPEGRPDPAFWAVDGQPITVDFVPNDSRNCTRVFRPEQPQWLQDAVVYEVFVRSFQDSDGDGKGDIRGLIQRLDVLNDGDPATQTDLGIDALWLMPIFASPSYHGYDVTDYYTIAADYGSMADFRDLVQACHQRGIRLILDLVINHTSNQHPWFQASKDPNSAYRNWYVWSATNPNWQSPWGSPVWHASNSAFYYGLFWSGMPDLNFHQPDVRNEIQKIVSYWLGLGVDGFRIDAARYLYEEGPGPGQQYDAPATISWLKDLQRFCQVINPESALILEVWDSSQTIARYVNNQGPLAFNFPLSDALIQTVKQTQVQNLRSTVCGQNESFQPTALDANFLTNHDQTRLATQLDGNPTKLKNAASLLLTLPGVPFVYYGEELGLRNGPGSADEQKRLPYAWDPSPKVGFTNGTPWVSLPPNYGSQNLAFQRDDPQSLWRHYHKMIDLRHQHSALRTGSLSPVQNNREPLIWSHFCESEVEQVLVVINLYNARIADIQLNLNFLAPGSVLFEGQSANTLTSNSNGMWVVDSLNAGDVRIFQVVQANQ